MIGFPTYGFEAKGCYFWVLHIAVAPLQVKRSSLVVLSTLLGMHQGFTTLKAASGRVFSET